MVTCPVCGGRYEDSPTDGVLYVHHCAPRTNARDVRVGDAPGGTAAPDTPQGDTATPGTNVRSRLKRRKAP